MQQNSPQISNQLILAIHSTENTFGFALRKNNNQESDSFLLKKFENNLCNNLIIDFNKFISKENLQKVNRISVSLGPSNFNASRLIVVLARTISQQINCPLDSISSFELISKRIALKNKIYENNQAFWIYKKLKRKGFIAGKYIVCNSDDKKENLMIKEKVVPKIFQELLNKENSFEANYEDEKDLKELLNLSNRNSKIPNPNSWETVLPLYPLSPIN